MIAQRSILITGGTGSFGSQFVREVLRKWANVQRLVVLSRDEFKQSQMAREYPIERYPQLRYFIGDVRDRSRLRRAFEDIDTVIHAAALKQVPAAEYNPIEFINTNVIGAENVIEAAMDAGVRQVISISTDKAAAPINLYGATKLCSDKLFVAANNFKGKRMIKFSVVRYGNVMGSRGSVIPFLIDKARDGILPITDRRMTRFNIPIKTAVDAVFRVMENAQGGEIFVPKSPSFRLFDLAEAIGPSCRIEFIGIRPGEKLHEDMITSNDSLTTVDLGEFYAIMPNTAAADHYTKTQAAAYVRPGFVYSSCTNSSFLGVEMLRQLIRLHVDPTFKPV